MTVTADDLHVKRKESVKDSTDVKIADSRMEEKDDDYPQFPDNSENHTCNEEGVKKCKKRKNKDSLWVKQNKRKVIGTQVTKKSQSMAWKKRMKSTCHKNL